MDRLGITGGSGFIGRALNARLDSLGREQEALQIGRTDPGVGRFARFDLDAPESEPLPDIACLAHVAAYVPDDQHGADALVCERANGGGMLRLLAALDLEKLGRVVHAGSFHVWDAARPDRVTNAYEGSKLSALMLLRAHAQRFDFEWTSLGLPYVYGPGMVHGKMFRTFIACARAARPLELYNGGRDPLHLLFVDDAAEAILAAIDADAGAGDVDIAPEAPVTVAEVAETIVELTGSSSEIRLLPGDPAAARPHDTSPARERLGFKPRTTLREGLAALLAAGFGDA